MTTATDDLDEMLADSQDEDVQTKPSDANLGFKTKKFVLQALLEKAAAVLPSRDIMPVLKNYQIEVMEAGIRVVATDLELAVVATHDMVSVTKTGTAVFPGKQLLDIVREAEAGELILDVTDGDATIIVGRAKWHLKLMDGSEYPPLPDVDTVELVEVDRARFLAALTTVKYAAATETTRPSLMMVSIAGGRMRAADGVRFQQVQVGNDIPDLDIPIAAVTDLLKMLKTTDANAIEVGETDSHLIFKVGPDVFIASQLTVPFPDIDAVLLRPALGNNEKFTCDRQELMAAVRRVRITADTNSSAIVLKLGTNLATLTSQDKFGNTCVEEIDASWITAGREVALNHVFFTDMLESTDAKSVVLFFGVDSKASKSPVLLRDDEAGQIGVLSQMRADWIL